VLGHESAEQRVWRAIIDGDWKDLGTLPGGTWSSAEAINDRGQIVGLGDTPEGPRAFLWEKGEMRSLGTLPGGTNSQATGINARGQIVGVSYVPNGPRAFLWENGAMTELPLPSPWTFSSANDINARGQIIGQVSVGGSEERAVLWITDQQGGGRVR
jgi:probable HAF family extracellular repeat protein